MVSVLDGNWAVVEQAIGGKLAGKAARSGSAQDVEELRKATLDSVRALMMIRAYRMRGHLIADLDPLNLREKQAIRNLIPRRMVSGRKILIAKSSSIMCWAWNGPPSTRSWRF